MNKGWKTWVTTMGAFASILVLATTTCDPAFLGFVADDVDEQTLASAQDFIPWQDRAADLVEQVPVDPPEGLGYWVRFLDQEERGVEGNVLVGAPGMWPPLTETTREGGFLELPPEQTQKMGGDPIRLYELLVRSAKDVEPAKAFWGVVRGPDEPVDAESGNPIRLREAHPLELTVIDENGEPIDGAFVRLSRDSIGMVHLNYTTEADGLALFQNIPTGTYFLTLDADDYARQTIRVEHTGQGTRNLQIVLEGGSGLRLPQSWRGPPVPEMAGNSSAANATANDSGVDSAENDDSRDGTEASEEVAEKADQEPDQDRIAIEVFAADNRGSGVQGAWLEAWVNGERVAQTKSAGRQGAIMDVPAGQRVDIIATHAGWGEGSKSVFEPSDGDDYIVRMDNDLLTAREASDRILRIASIEDILGAPLADDRRSWVVDRPDDDSRAARAGLQRGDSLLFLRNEGSKHRAVLERNGAILEIEF